MSIARLNITAVVIEGRSQASVARDYGVSKGLVSKLIARYRAEGDVAFEPRSRRPHSRPETTPAVTVDLVLELRRRLAAQGLDARADTIAWHLEHHHRITLSRATIYRIVRRHDLVIAEPKKKPRWSYIRFEADQPSETWQADFTHHRLADGTDIEILTWLDDHSTTTPATHSVTAHRPVTGPIVVTTFRAVIAHHGIPFSTLTDNGLVFTTRFPHGGRTSRNGLENELVRLRVQHPMRVRVLADVSRHHIERMRGIEPRIQLGNLRFDRTINAVTRMNLAFERRCESRVHQSCNYGMSTAPAHRPECGLCNASGPAVIAWRRRTAATSLP